MRACAVVLIVQRATRFGLAGTAFVPPHFAQHFVEHASSTQHDLTELLRCHGHSFQHVSLTSYSASFFHTSLRLPIQSERPNFHFAIELISRPRLGSDDKEHHSRLARFMIDFGAGWHLNLALKIPLVVDLEGREDSAHRSVLKQIKPLFVSVGHVITVLFYQALVVLTDDPTETMIAPAL